MTVRTDHTIQADIRSHAAQLAWLEAEFNARAAFALVRLDSLDVLGQHLPTDDCFDSAYAIWDDYIDGRRADERGEKLIAPQLAEQACIFARVSKYLPAAELYALASRAWGSETFEVFTRHDLTGDVTGRLGWYRGDHLSVVAIVPDVMARPGVLTRDLNVWAEQGRIRHDVSFTHHRKGLALHPIFSRFGS